MKHSKWQLITTMFNSRFNYVFSIPLLLEIYLPLMLLALIMFYSPISTAGKYDGEYSPSWSPDGEYLLFHKQGHGYVWDMVVKNIQSGESENITNSDAMEVDGSWSPDGSKIAFAVRDNNSWDLYVYDLHTKQTMALIQRQGKDNDPSWSVDSQYILFLSDRSGSSQLHQVEVATKKVTQLTHTKRPISHLSTSTDGKYAIFDQYFAFTGDKKGGRSKIYQFDLKTHQIEHLYSGPGSSIAGYKHKDTLYFSNNRHGNWDIFRVNLQTGEEQQLIAGPDNEMKGAIDPQGKRMAFSFFSEKGAKVKIVSL